MNHLPKPFLVLALVALLAAACSPTSGPLGTPATPPTDGPAVGRGAVGRCHARPLVDRRPPPRPPPARPRRRRPRPRREAPTARADGDTRADQGADRHHDRPRLLLPRQLHRQRRPRAGAARDPEDPGRGDGRDEGAARRPQRRRARRAARDVHRHPRWHEAPRPDDQGRRGDGRPVRGVRVGRRARVDPRPARAGRVHADPVPDRRPGAVQARRRARHRVRRRRGQARPPRRPRRLHEPAAGDLHGPARVGRAPSATPAA